MNMHPSDEEPEFRSAFLTVSIVRSLFIRHRPCVAFLVDVRQYIRCYYRTYRSRGCDVRVITEDKKRLLRFQDEVKIANVSPREFCESGPNIQSYGSVQQQY